MSAKNSIYWPVFLIVAALSTAAVWKFAPVAPIPDDCRAWCVKMVKRVTQSAAKGNPGTDVGRASAVESRMSQEAPPSSPVPVARPEAAPAASTAVQKNDSAKQGVIVPPQSAGRPPRDRRPEVAKSSSPAPAPTAKAPAEVKVEELAQAEASDDAIAMTPAQRKKKYEELSKKAEARRLQILRENLTRSEEGRKALAAVKAFKELAAKVDELKKKYGETDSRVTSKRGDLLRLKDDVRRTNEAYKRWKEKNPQKFVVPESDEEYRKIIGERQLYAE